MYTYVHIYIKVLGKKIIPNSFSSVASCMGHGIFISYRVFRINAWKKKRKKKLYTKATALCSKNVEENNLTQLPNYSSFLPCNTFYILLIQFSMNK